MTTTTTATATEPHIEEVTEEFVSEVMELSRTDCSRATEEERSYVEQRIEEDPSNYWEKQRLGELASRWFFANCNKPGFKTFRGHDEGLKFEYPMLRRKRQMVLSGGGEEQDFFLGALLIPPSISPRSGCYIPPSVVLAEYEDKLTFFFNDGGYFSFTCSPRDEDFGDTTTTAATATEAQVAGAAELKLWAVLAAAKSIIGGMERENAAWWSLVDAENDNIEYGLFFSGSSCSSSSSSDSSISSGLSSIPSRFSPATDEGGEEGADDSSSSCCNSDLDSVQ